MVIITTSALFFHLETAALDLVRLGAVGIEVAVMSLTGDGVLCFLCLMEFMI